MDAFTELAKLYSQPFSSHPAYRARPKAPVRPYGRKHRWIHRRHPEFKMGRPTLARWRG